MALNENWETGFCFYFFSQLKILNPFVYAMNNAALDTGAQHYTQIPLENDVNR